LEKLGVKASFEDGDVKIHLNHAVAVSEILQELSNARIPFAELQLKRSSLEDVFLNLTGEALQEED
jgi:hypothetical protein